FEFDASICSAILGPGADNAPPIIARGKRRRKLPQWRTNLFPKCLPNRRGRLLWAALTTFVVAKFQIATKSPACIAPLDCRRSPTAGSHHRICNMEIFVEKVGGSL
ncbi:MAG TPA: hypothetical protein VKB81_00580, partial [Nitrospira sp.]|nr:hypothetical protein [Nitrospira sp.]